MLLKGKRVKISRAIFRQALFTFFYFFTFKICPYEYNIFLYLYTIKQRKEEEGVRGSPYRLILCNHILKIKQITL